MSHAPINPDFFALWSDGPEMSLNWLFPSPILNTWGLFCPSEPTERALSLQSRSPTQLSSVFNRFADSVLAGNWRP
jgi:hypothetical protein